jgi:hypothetical protein
MTANGQRMRQDCEKIVLGDPRPCAFPVKENQLVITVDSFVQLALSPSDQFLAAPRRATDRDRNSSRWLSADRFEHVVIFVSHTPPKYYQRVTEIRQNVLVNCRQVRASTD